LRTLDIESTIAFERVNLSGGFQWLSLR